ncbi:sialidase family protein [Actinophytocola xanthii]|uniref:sialidase family protein n=1 Tax=Actinophytocola xanthii TaxID=1912961 RepID=UPI001300F26F|nr:sialidase family protein [Actinophytocola xanthii]
MRARGFRAVGVDAAYSAFPSICRFESGDYRLVWRQGSDHVASRDGVVRTSVSTDGGLSWGAASTAVAGPAGRDLRDPCIATSNGTTWLTYFAGTTSDPAMGAFVRISQDQGAFWGDEIRIDPEQPYAAISAPVVALGDGRLLAAYYGRDTGHPSDSCWLATSADGGLSWTRTPVADGPAAGTHFQEPWLVTRGAEVWMLFRHGNRSGIGAAVSTDGGVSWSKPVELFRDATGRPAAAWLESGALAVVVRRISDRQPVVRTREAAGGWLPAKRTLNQPAAGPLGMQYAHPLVVPGGVVCPIGIEHDPTSASLHVGWLADSAGRSPLGDVFPDEQLAVAADLDHLLVADAFTRVDGPLTWPWQVGAGDLAVADGYVVSPFADDTPGLAWQDVGTPDVDLSGDFWWTGQAGYGLLGRVAGPGAYLLLTVETGGTALRLYRVNAGTATQLAAAAVAVPPATWTRLRLELRGNRLQGFLNGAALVAHSLTGSEQADFLGRGGHGIKLNAQGDGVHRCRLCTVRA